MSYKRFFLGVLFIFSLYIVGTLCLSWLIDPIGIWNSPVVRGFNNYKVNQPNYLDVYKPYEYMREKPDILYIGASEMYVGFEPICTTDSEKKVYTMGLSSLPLADLKEYLRFIYKVHKPQIIYVGLSPRNFMFAESFIGGTRPGYSKERLERLSTNQREYYEQAIKDSLGIHNVFWETVKQSNEHKAEGPLMIRGWDTVRGAATSLDPERYYKHLWRNFYNSSFKDWFFIPEALECWRTIVAEAKDAGIPLVAFFAPCTVDFYADIELHGCGNEYKRVKREVAQVVDIYDFAIVSEITINRNPYFEDMTHFHATCGERLKRCLENGDPAPYGYLLTSENVDAVLLKEDAAWEKWKSENKEYMNALKEIIETGRKPEVGEFKQYIGF